MNTIEEQEYADSKERQIVKNKLTLFEKKSSVSVGKTLMPGVGSFATTAQIKMKKAEIEAKLKNE